MKFGHVISAVLAAGAVAIVVLTLGVEVTFPVAWGIAAGAVTMVVMGFASFEHPRWPPPRKPEETIRGSEVARLAWSFDVRSGVAGFAVKRRIRALAERRLAEHGLTLDPEDLQAVRSLLGDAGTRALTAATVRRDDINATLDALDALSAPRQEER